MNKDKDTFDKRAPEKYRNYEPEIIKICTNCMGTAPCWCGHPEYKEYWGYVYRAVKNCKGI